MWYNMGEHWIQAHWGLWIWLLFGNFWLLCIQKAFIIARLFTTQYFLNDLMQGNDPQFKRLGNKADFIDYPWAHGTCSWDSHSDEHLGKALSLNEELNCQWPNHLRRCKQGTEHCASNWKGTVAFYSSLTALTNHQRLVKDLRNDQRV